MMPGLLPVDHRLSQATSVKPSTGDQELSPKLSNQIEDPPPHLKRTAAPVATAGSGTKAISKRVDTKAYNKISLLNKWRLLQAILADSDLSPTAKVVAGVLLDCLNCKTGKCYPSLAYLAARIGKKRRVISAAITQLRQRGWISRRGRRGSSVYDFAFDRLHQHGVQETTPREREGVRKTAYLGAQGFRT
jgi:hypothetical protein